MKPLSYNSDLFYFIIVFFSLALQSCSTTHNDTLSNNPAWVNKAITLTKQNASTVPITIARYHYRNQTVYYISPAIADGFSQLFDKKQTLICAPDGGLIGKGDEQCTNFFQQATNKVILLKKSP